MENKELKISQLQSLIQSEGWKLILEELKGDIEITESKLFGEVKMAEHETVENLRRERIDRLELISLPENLIRELAEKESEEPDYEVYK